MRLSDDVITTATGGSVDGENSSSRNWWNGPISTVYGVTDAARLAATRTKHLQTLQLTPTAIWNAKDHMANILYTDDEANALVITPQAKGIYVPPCCAMSVNLYYEDMHDMCACIL
jgi:hypothetical protein